MKGRDPEGIHATPGGAPEIPQGGGPQGAPLREAAPPRGAPQPRLTSRAAVLAVVICAIALSLAYPVREYIAQRQQINQLVSEQQMMQDQLRSLVGQRGQLADPAYIEQLAGQELHMCFPGEQCYVIDNGQSVLGAPKPPSRGPAPWYDKLWHSVQQADQEPGK
jgi:cell division protein FtsB